MICPRCAIEMEHLTRQGVTLDRCEVCGGIWLDKGELDTIVESVRPPVVLAAPEPSDPTGTTERARPRGPDSRRPAKDRHAGDRHDDDYDDDDDDDDDDRYRHGSRKAARGKRGRRPISAKARLAYILKEILD